MRLAFCLFKYFPFGGLQRDFLRIASECKKRGHEIHVYTTEWEGEREMGFHLHLVKAKAWQNHARVLAYAYKVKKELETERYDLVIGFNKMPYLDIYYAADVCYQARVREHRRALYRLLPRYRQHVAFEESVFAAGQSADIFLISPHQQMAYKSIITEPSRFHLLPPGIDKSRNAPANAAEIRARLRKTLKLTDQDKLLLMVDRGLKPRR